MDTNNAAIGTYFILMLFFTLKHFLADYVWQTQYMLRKGSAKGWVTPLVAHCAVHAGLTLLVLLPATGSKAFILAIADGVIHFVVDAVKAQKLKYPFPTKGFWVSLGGDQAAHHATYALLAYLAVV